jgi:outer membrane immunogenic protein
VQPCLLFNTIASNRYGGAIAGGQIGYDYQFANQMVMGLETDLQWSGIQSWHQGTTAGALTPNGFVYSDNMNAMTWFGSTRARIGYARGATLLYVTAGVAYGGLTATSEQFSGAQFTGATSKSQAGWTLGSGAEYPLTDKMSLKAEYLYTSFDGINGPAANITPAPFPGLLATSSFATQVTRVGLNWRFGGSTTATAGPIY